MADQLLTGTTLVEKESRSAGDITIGGIIEFDDTYSNVPDGFNLCDGSTINDSRSAYNGVAVPDLNTDYLTVAGASFTELSNTSATVSWDASGTLLSGDAGEAVATIQIPNGSKVTGAVLYGSSATPTWLLKRKTLSGGAVSTMATANNNTEDTTISNETIDNDTYTYVFSCSHSDSNIYGARITYTPRFKFIIRIR